MELILKIEMNKLTDEAKKVLMNFISLSEPKPVKTELEKKLQDSIHLTVNPIVKEKKGPGRPAKEKMNQVDNLNEPDENDQTKAFDEDETPSENGKQEVTRETIRDKVIALRDKGKKDKTLKVMGKFGIAKLSDLEDEDLDSFDAALNNIK